MTNTSGSGYPLATLFVLVTACAALAAAATPTLRVAIAGDLDEEQLLAVLIGCILGSVLLGALVGLLNFHWLAGSAIGALAGLVVGGAAGLLAMTPTDQLPGVAAALVIGSGLMVGIAMALRPHK